MRISWLFGRRAKQRLKIAGRARCLISPAASLALDPPSPPEGGFDYHIVQTHLPAQPHRHEMGEVIS